MRSRTPTKAQQAKVQSPRADPNPAPLPPPRPVPREQLPARSEAEHEARKLVAMQLVAMGVTWQQLPQALADQGWPVTAPVARSLYEQILTEWSADHQHLRETSRAAQVQRLNSDLARLRRDAGSATATNKDGRQVPAHAARAAYQQAVLRTEELLARIQGHLAPAEHVVRLEASAAVRQGVVEIVSALTDEELDAMLAEDERERARALPPAVVDAAEE